MQRILQDMPARVLFTGATIPAIGLGTFGSDHADPTGIARAVGGAYEAGYRHFDCAAVYGNEPEIGAVFAELFASGARREDLWVTSKLWNDMHGRVEEACRRSLADLQIPYLDLYLVHWPFPNWHAPGCAADSRSPDARPYIQDEFVKTWRQMEHLVELGLTRHIGTSNMTIPKLRRLLRDARIKPAVNQMEHHPHFQQPELFEFLSSSGIVSVGYCPLGSPNRPERDKTPEDTIDMDDPVIVEIARRHGLHPAAICLKWAVQRGIVPIPMSTKPDQYIANLQAIRAGPLSGEDMRRIAGIDRNCRLVKGQVFLWKPGQSWEDLWDVDGYITPP
jgi:diketogulonate reductase-like aldo/keto reductase